MFQTTISPTALQDLRSHLRGEVLSPYDSGYDSARRVWNGMIDRYPVLIARCTSTQDIVSAVQFARQHRLPVAIRGGGHSYAGYGTCDGGLIIDLSNRKKVQVDPVRRTAWAEAGLRLGEFLRETQASGLVTPVGAHTETGLTGLTLGGGLGLLMGKYGLTIDNLLAVEIVTSEGRMLRASADEHANLFWAVRGGGGNFGVVSAFHFQLHPLMQVLAGSVLHPLERAGEVLRFYREFTHSMPDELTVYASLVTTPHGLPVITLVLCYCGPLEEGQRLIGQVKTFGSPLLRAVRPMSYLNLTSLLDATAPCGKHYYSQTCTLATLNDEAIAILIASGQQRTSPLSQIVLQHVHGAASRVHPTATAFALRGEYYVLHILASWQEDAAGNATLHREWARSLWEHLQPLAIPEAYSNYQGDEAQDEPAIRASYGVNYERLVALKNSYDPTNLFHLNQNIKLTI